MITFLWRLVWGGCYHEWEDQHVIQRVELNDAGNEYIDEHYMVQRCEACGRYRREHL